MGFNLDAALAEILATPVATVATVATNRQSVAKVAGVAAYQPPATKPPEVLPFTPPPSAKPIPSREDDDTFRHGRSATGNPVTWTGRIVRLDEWKRLSEWDSHGQDGRLWCGICREWASSFPECHGGAA